MQFINLEKLRYALKLNRWPVKVKTDEEQKEDDRQDRLKKLYPNK